MWINQIKDMITLCELNNNFHCGIYINSEPLKRTIICNTIKDLAKNNKNVLKMMMSKNTPELYFKNGSYIKVINANDCARGYRNHMVLIDRYIDEKTEQCIIYPKLINPAIKIYIDIDDIEIESILKEI